jgi:membrane protein YdbS with pleckstrin-like domain
MDERAVFAIEKPHPNLMKQYVLQSMLAGPALLIVLPLLYFRYHSMRYRFDEHGVTMRWGVLMRREVHLTYSRIQDIHLTSGPIQRYLGLADLLVQTASGSASAEMVIEGLLEYEGVRDYLYSKMRGIHGEAHASLPAAADGVAGAAGAAASLAGASGAAGAGSLAAALGEVTAELRAGREALERVAAASGGREAR